ncbi:MAG: PAS domain S-box protein [Chloroflexi bacterium]|nr:PAS domain S-box protein [Chloroflexota bacterium]
MKGLRLSLAAPKTNFDDVFEYAPVGIFQSTLGGRYINVNPAMTRMYGYNDPAEMVTAIADIGRQIHANTETRKLFADTLLKQGRVEHFEAKNYRKDGSIIWTSTNARLVRDENGSPLYFEGFTTDITDHKLTEEALKQSEEKYRLLITGIGVNEAIFTVDTQGHITYISPAIERLAQYTAEEVIGQAFARYVHPDDLPGLQASYERTLAGIKEPYEFRVLAKDGSIRHVMTFSQQQIEAGQVTGLIGVMADITEHKRAEMATRANEERYRALYHDNPTMFFTLDTDAKVIAVNDFGASQLGYTVDELEGKTVLKVFHEADRPAVLEQFKSCLENPGKAFHWQFRKVRKDGSVLWVEEFARAVIGPDNTLHVLVVCQDISERKRVEIEQEALYQIVAATISAPSLDDLYHSIHQVLASIIPAKNFYIALYDEDTNLLTFPYFVDEYDKPSPPAPPDHGLTEYVLRTQKPLLASPEVFEKLVKAGEVETVGVPSLDWVGVPLTVADRTIGVMVMQTYEEGIRYGQRELEILQFVSSQVAMAIQRKQAEESLASSEEQYRALFANVPVGLGVVDLSGKFLAFNEAILLPGGYSRKDILDLGNVESLYFDQEDRNKIVEMLRQHKQVKKYPVQFKRKDGTPYDALLTLTPIQFNGQSSIQAMVEDVSEQKKAEEALRESEQRYRTLVEQASDGIFISDMQGNYKEVNTSGCTMLGYKPEEILRLNIRDLILPEEIQTQPLRMREMREGKTVIAQRRFRRKDGSRFTAEVSSQLLPDGRVLGVVRDITERIRAEEVRLEEQKKFRSMIENSMDGMALYTAEANVIYQSPAVKKILGYEPEEIRGANVAEFIHPEDADRIGEVYQKVLESPSEAFTAEARVRHKDGSYRWLEVIISNKLNEPGIRALVANYHDITERKEAERILKESEEQYRHLVEHSPYAVAIHSQGILVYLNQAGVKLIGAKSAQEIYGTPIINFVHPDSRPRVLQRLKELSDGKEAPPLEERFLRQDGSAVSVEVTAYPFTYQNRPAVQVVIRDLTEQKQAQQAIQASEERFSKAFHSSPIPTCITTLEDGHFLDVNQAYLKLSNWKREDVLGRTAEELNIYPNGSRTDFIQRLLNNEIAQGVQDKFVISTGEALDVAAFYELIEVGGQTCILSMFYNMTEQNRSRELLRASEERLRAIVDHTQNIYYSHNPDHVLTYVSAQVKNILGYEPEEALIKWQDLLTNHPINQRGIGLTQKAIDTGLPQEPYVIELRAKDGSHVWAEVRETPVVRDGKTVAVVGALTDISERKEAEERLERHIAELTVFHAVALAGSQSYREDEVIERTTQIVNGMLYPENCGVLLLGHSGNTLKPHSSYRGVAEESIIAEFPISMGITGRVASTGQLARINDVGSDPDYIKTTEGVRSELCVPIRVNEKIIGVFNTESRKQNAFDEEDERVLITIAGALGTAIERIRLGEEESRRSKIIEALADIANVIATTRDTKNALDEIARRSITLLKARNVAIYLLQEDNETIKVVTAHGSYHDELLSHSIKLGRGITGDIIARGRSEIINDTAKDPRRMVIPGTPEEDNRIETMMSAALILRGKPIGAINAWRLRSEGLFNESELNFLNSIAHQASIAIESGHLYQETVRRAEESKAIAEVGREISATLQLDIVLKRIATYAKDLLQAETSAVYLAETNSSILHAVAAIGIDEEEIKSDPLTIGRGILGSIALNKVGEIVNRASSDPRAIVIKGTEANPLEHIMGAAVLSKDQLTGLLVVWRSGEGQEFKSSELDFLIGLAQQAAVAIENARLFNAEQKRRREAEALRIATEVISSSLDLENVLDTILSSLKQVVQYDSASIFLIEQDRVRIKAAQGLPNLEEAINGLFPANNALLRAIHDSGFPLILRDARADSRFEKWVAADEVRGWMGVPLMTHGQIIGYITLDSYRVGAFDENSASLAQSFAHQAAVAIENAELFENLQKSNVELSHAYDTTLEGWGKALELRDKETQGHTERVSELTLKLARKMGLGKEELVKIQRGVLVHDIGKMGVPDHILHKKGPLTKKEWAEMRKHPQYAFDLLYPIPYLRPALDIAFCHHERWDGTGYPRGLKGEQIPLAARIFAVVDVWDALLFKRPYRQAWTKKKILKYIREQSGKHFDPQVVEIFLKMMNGSRKK